jgi:hypothetical protein
MSKTPFCKVCFDSGKPDTKHWVKDRNNKVCCPTLLALKCRLCGQCGHTVKYCSKTQPNPKPLQVKKPLNKPLVTLKSEPKNMFDLLFNNDSDEEPDEQEQSKQQEQAKEEPKKQEQAKQHEQAKPTVVKRWIDYDSDSDDELPLSINPLPMPTLKRYGHSENSVESLMEVGM